MPIYKEKKIINIGIPKTCCTSIYHTFKDKNNKWLLDTKNICIEGNNKPISHMTLKEFTDYYKNINISEYTIFTIIRNPYDKIFSVYNHLKNVNQKNTFTNKIDVNHLTFNQWILKIKKILENNDEYYHNMLTSQTSFLKLDNKIPEYLKIFRYEELGKLEDYFNIKLQHLNKGNSNLTYKKVYNEVSQEFIYNYYKEDFLYFNYNKEL